MNTERKSQQQHWLVDCHPKRIVTKWWISIEASGIRFSIHSTFRKSCFQLDIQYDHFIRTSEPRHQSFVQDVVNRVWENGDIYLDTYEGYYCIDCEEYKDKDQMDKDHRCLIHQKPCSFRSEVAAQLNRLIRIELFRRITFLDCRNIRSNWKRF